MVVLLQELCPRDLLQVLNRLLAKLSQPLIAQKWVEHSADLVVGKNTLTILAPTSVMIEACAPMFCLTCLSTFSLRIFNIACKQEQTSFKDLKTCGVEKFIARKNLLIISTRSRVLDPEGNS